MSRGLGRSIGLCLLLTIGCTEAPPALQEYTVVTGDSLSAIARSHGTTVAAIRSENQIVGDLIEVGQVLRIPGDHPPPEQKATVPKRRSTPQKEKPCLAAPSLDGAPDQAMVASVGLSEDQIRQTMNSVFSDLSSCFSAGWPRATVDFSISVHCSGRVERTTVIAAEGIDDALLGCVQGHLGRAVFPPHDIHPVFTFRYPMHITPG